MIPPPIVGVEREDQEKERQKLYEALEKMQQKLVQLESTFESRVQEQCKLVVEPLAKTIYFMKKERKLTLDASPTDASTTARTNLNVQNEEIMLQVEKIQLQLTQSVQDSQASTSLLNDRVSMVEYRIDTCQDGLDEWVDEYSRQMYRLCNGASSSFNQATTGVGESITNDTHSVEYSEPGGDFEKSVTSQGGGVSLKRVVFDVSGRFEDGMINVLQAPLFLYFWLRGR